MNIDRKIVEQALNAIRGGSDEPDFFLVTALREVLDTPPEKPLLATQLEIAMGALNRLACLGNGDQHGNSMGNDIAICAIKQVQGLAK